MPLLEPYLSELLAARLRGVAETSHYPPLRDLLNEVGAGLRPRVTATVHVRNTGAGIPDLGLYIENQPDGQTPARGIVEAKPVAADLLAIANGEQVARYVAQYGQALVTNYYQFVLVTRDGQTGKPVIEERYDLAPDASAFWEAAKQPGVLARTHDAPLREYLLRALRRNAPLTNPQDVAWILASYAREAKARIEAGSADLRKLDIIRRQLETALGVRFEDAAAEDFFRSTLVQTLFYGLFSAWVLWHERHPGAGTFDLWRDTRRLNIPVISELFNQFSDGTNLPLSVEQVLDWTTDALNRVDRPAFFSSFNTGAAVQYFYEPFLEAFDPDLRRQLGVWYTPPEVVEYMVARVDRALKDELGIADGLADSSVYVLDPCCGTGAYLVAVLRHVYATLRARDGDALAAQAVQAAMRDRIYGFEILPAPFVVAHLQIGMLLANLHAPLSGGQRAGVYLTNALTGWEAATGPQTALMFPELAREREAAEQVKQRQPILVILGNPPYSGFAGVAVDEERSLSQAYRTTRNPALPTPTGQGLNDLYVRFYRMAERQIVERTQRGIVCFISNYSWLDGLSHPGMRERYLEAFDQMYVDNLHGDRIISEYAPDGRTSETVFAMAGASVGIRIGTAIATLIRKSEAAQTTPRATLYYRDWDQARADERRAALLASLAQPEFKQGYGVLQPAVQIGLPFKPRIIGGDYLSWAKLTELFPTYFAGVKTSRDDVVVDIDRDKLDARMQQYFDAEVSHDELRRIAPGFMTSSARYPAESIRDRLRARGYLSDKLVRYSYRPFDVRWLYWEPETKLLDEKRPDYFPHVQPGNIWLIASSSTRRDWNPPQLTHSIGSLHLDERGTNALPLYLYPTQQPQLGLFDAEPAAIGGRTPNLSDKAKAYLVSHDLTPEDGAPLLFYHALATLHAPAYRVENAGALRQDWPRVPLPARRDRLEASAALGRQVAALLDVETPVPAVTQGDPRPDLATVAVLTTLNGSAPDFTCRGWGYRGANGIMAGTGRIVEHDGVVDVMLNETTTWKGIPSAVWDYTLGGYQVLKKWLSYRDVRVLEHPLTPEEARDFMHIARRITALIGLQDALDSNYRAVSG
jgi:hypothetical protein